ncbi:hypothetical protein V5799_005194, partial [Amblyomma americanum]
MQRTQLLLLQVTVTWAVCSALPGTCRLRTDDATPPRHALVITATNPDQTLAHIWQRRLGTTTDTTERGFKSQPASVHFGHDTASSMQRTQLLLLQVTVTWAVCSALPGTCRLRTDDATPPRHALVITAPNPDQTLAHIWQRRLGTTTDITDRGFKSQPASVHFGHDTASSMQRTQLLLLQVTVTWAVCSALPGTCRLRTDDATPPRHALVITAPNPDQTLAHIWQRRLGTTTDITDRGFKSQPASVHFGHDTASSMQRTQLLLLQVTVTWAVCSALPGTCRLRTDDATPPRHALVITAPNRDQTLAHIWQRRLGTTTDTTERGFKSQPASVHFGHDTASSMQRTQLLLLQVTVTWAVCSALPGACRLRTDDATPPRHALVITAPNPDQTLAHIWQRRLGTTTDTTERGFKSQPPSVHFGHDTASSMQRTQLLLLQVTVTWAVCSALPGTCRLRTDDATPPRHALVITAPNRDQTLAHIWQRRLGTTTDTTERGCKSQPASVHFGHDTASSMQRTQLLLLQVTVTWAVCSALPGACRLRTDDATPPRHALVITAPNPDQTLAHIWQRRLGTTTDTTERGFKSQPASVHFGHDTASSMQRTQLLLLQ